MNRWVLRVAAYTALMTDDYPPFRLDTGGTDPATTTPVEPDPERSAIRTTGWSPARTAGVVVGAQLLLVGFGGATGGGALLWLDGQRDSAGYLSTPVEEYTTSGYALRFDADDVAPVDRDWPWVGDVLGDVRTQVSGVDSERMFVGVARTSDVATYLSGVPHRRFGHYYRHTPRIAPMMTTRLPGAPRGMDFWVASTSGTGTLTLDWAPRPGDWSLVVMDTSARQEVRADIGFAATAPALRPVAIGVLVGGVVLLLAGAWSVALAACPRQPRG